MDRKNSQILSSCSKSSSQLRISDFETFPLDFQKLSLGFGTFDFALEKTDLDTFFEKKSDFMSVTHMSSFRKFFFTTALRHSFERQTVENGLII